MAKRNPQLTTTTYAILGQLAWGEATTYELVKAMGRNLRFMWPRAESRIYEEAKRLTAAGYAEARTGRTGRRRRTVYAITGDGRRALRDWLAGPPEGITLEHGPLLRILLGREARPQDLLAAVSAVRDHAERLFAVGAPLADEYLDRRHPQQAEVHLRALTYDYLFHWAQLNSDWADRAEAELRRWRDTEPSAAKHRRALERIRALRARLPAVRDD
ncbi:MAG TPA: PadR family transcriptional regulator [Solirubrobacterales bacterium]|nr:PadR family transcriptional regulator [Solirubrobacterales bacterium]